MKANAKKLLALIMAFAMVMSLAAPAMAADASGSGNTATLETQAVKSNVKSITEATGGKAGYRITFTTDTDVAGGYVEKAWTDADSVYATVTTADYGTKLIGTKKKVKKTVTSTADYTAAGTNPVTAEFVIDDPAGILYKVSDDGTAWSELGTTVDWFGTSPMLQVKGSVYQEAQPDGSFKLFYKLTPTTTSGSDTVFDTSASAKPVYAVATTSSGVAATFTASEWDSDTEKRAALESAMVINPDTYTVGTPLSASIVGQATVSLGGATGAYTYTYANYGEEGATFTLGEDSFAVTWGSGVNTTATVKARVTYDANQFATPKVATATTLETNVDSVKADLAKKAKDSTGAGKWNLVSVTKDGDYMTVTVSRPDPSSIPTPDNVATATNVEAYSVGTVNKAGLTDLSQDGFWYDGNDSTGKTKNTIAKGTKLYGQVAIKKTDVPDEVNVTGTTYTSSTHYYFATEAAMKEGLENQNCGKDATVKYTKLVVNKKDGDKNNGAYSSGALNPDWVNATGAFVEKDQSYTVEDVVAHKVRLVKKITPATCGADGTEVDENTCKICGNVISSTTKTLPRDQSSLAVRNTSTTAHEYAFYDAAGNFVANTTYTTAASLPSHYLKTEKITTTLKTKESKGVITHDYYCNYGVLHPEWSWTEETDKTAMEHSGRWDNIVWSTQNTQYARDPSALYGYNFFVFDTDYELATLPLNDTTKYDHFTIASLTTGTVGAKPDGTYYTDSINKDVKTDGTAPTSTEVSCKIYTTTADGKKSSTDKLYMGNVIVKNIKKADKDCLDGSATIEINVYEVATATTADITPANVADTIKNKQATLVKTFTKDVVVPAEKTHVDANNDGKCDNCGTEIKQTTPDVPTTDKVLTASMVTVKNLTYTGKKQQPEVTVKTADGTELDENLDYEVATFKKIAAGTYTITVKGKGDWTGTIKAKVKINKAAQPMTVKATAPSAKQLKKKAQKVGLTIKKAQGKVSVKVSGPASVKGTTVTAKKGTKKGKKIKITVTAAGNDNYKKGSKTVTVKVKA